MTRTLWSGGHVFDGSGNEQPLQAAVASLGEEIGQGEPNTFAAGNPLHPTVGRDL